MARPQNSFKGLFAKQRIDMGANQLTYNSTAILFNQGVRLSGQANALLTGNSTGLVVLGGIKVSNKANAVLTGNSTGVITNAQLRIANARYINANSTGFIVTSESALPATDQGVAFTMISDSTGVAFAINATGTTWKYLTATSVRGDAS